MAEPAVTGSHDDSRPRGILSAQTAFASARLVATGRSLLLESQDHELLSPRQLRVHDRRSRRAKR